MGGYARLNGNLMSYACSLLLREYTLVQQPSTISIVRTPRGVPCPQAAPGLGLEDPCRLRRLAVGA